ncbi:MAG: hypothetical protein WBA41_10000 [Rivularia sp. (in: cyanobacteria)]
MKKNGHGKPLRWAGSPTCSKWRNPKGGWGIGHWVEYLWLRLCMCMCSYGLDCFKDEIITGSQSQAGNEL